MFNLYSEPHRMLYREPCANHYIRPLNQKKDLFASLVVDWRGPATTLFIPARVHVP